MTKAVLFLVFNRLDTTKKVFEEISKAKPSRLYISSDGARKESNGEFEVVREIREFILDNINWKCDVKTLFRDENLGCGRAVSKAITWFFEQEKDGIILEDDCLPNQDFFNFCEELLDYYEDNKKIMHISGDQFVPNFDNGASYYFAKNMHCWGWASWSDRWNEYAFNLKNYNKSNINKVSNDENVRKYFLEILKRLKNKEIDTWDYQWMFKIFEKGGLCINPSKNLVSNIGFGENSTHTSDENNPLSNLPTYEIKEIIHPKNMSINQYAVNYIFKDHFGINFKKEKKSLLKRILIKFLKK